jgi:hypothetical protein
MTNPRDAHDQLLWWCSEIGSGSWTQFGEGCRELGLTVAQASKALSALAHVEFDRRRGRWAVAPTVLSTIPRLPGRLLLSGARPSGLMEHLRVVAEHERVDVVVETGPIPQTARGPATLLLDGSAADGAAFATAAGIQFQPAAHFAIASLLPAADIEVLAEPATPDPRFPHCPIDPVTLLERWDLEAPEGGEGLWAWATFARRSARYLRRDGQWWYIPDSAWAPYLVSRPEGSEPLCRYEPAHQLLIVDSAAALPALHARAAVLCSGRLPLRQYLAEGIAEDHYVNVDDATAGSILASLTASVLSVSAVVASVGAAGHTQGAGHDDRDEGRLR